MFEVLWYIFSTPYTEKESMQPTQQGLTFILSLFSPFCHFSISRDILDKAPASTLGFPGWTVFNFEVKANLAAHWCAVTVSLAEMKT